MIYVLMGQLKGFCKIIIRKLKMNEMTIAGSDMICFICQDFFCKPCTAICGHSFCYYCIEEYLLFAQMCPICSKAIRNKSINPVPSLGEFVERCLKNDQEQLQNLQKRKILTKNYLIGKQLKGIRVGMKIDIRDSNYIWCEGMITRIYVKYQQNQRYVRVTYLNYLQSKEEDVRIGSQRLSVKGFYSSRKDIPYYQQKKANSLIKKLAY